SSSSTESAKRDTLTQDVGHFPAPPAGIDKPRVGVPPFNIQQGNNNSSKHGDLNDLAADQMTTLLFQSERFDVVERAQLPQLLKEQSLEGIVKSDELAKQAQVAGVDYLLLGKVTNLRVKRDSKKNGFGLLNVGGMFGGADVKN